MSLVVTHTKRFVIHKMEKLHEISKRSLNFAPESLRKADQISCLMYSNPKKLTNRHKCLELVYLSQFHNTSEESEKIINKISTSKFDELNDIMTSNIHIDTSNETNGNGNGNGNEYLYQLNYIKKIRNEFTMDEYNTLKNEIIKINNKYYTNYIPEPSPNLHLSKPENWYPLARSIKRKIIYHYGPTNSGKTHSALQSLINSSNGLYCAPLRLLAWEVFEKLNSEYKIKCNLETGEEKYLLDNCNITSCTMEMAPLRNVKSSDGLFDCVILDEIQLMATENRRGGAWTRALLGVPAKEIHVCGDNSCKELIEKLVCENCNDNLEFKSYNRLCDLKMDKIVRSYNEIQKGDCIIGFNRNDLFNIKTKVEQNTSHKCSIVYGRLPPGNRRTQANLFNNNVGQYNVLVASDAIGLGLNLNIRRIVFSSIKKFNGFKHTLLTNNEVLQISGRAGRYGKYSCGYVTAMNDFDYKYVSKILYNRKLSSKTYAYLKPEEEHLYNISKSYPWLKFRDILKCFDLTNDKLTLDSEYIMPQLDDYIKISSVIENIPLSFDDFYIFITIPLRSYNIELLSYIQEWAIKISKNNIILIDNISNLLNELIKNIKNKNNIFTLNDIYNIELIYNILCAYNYLSLRFSQFIDGNKCDKLLTQTAQLIQDAFDYVTINNKDTFVKNYINIKAKQFG